MAFQFLCPQGHLLQGDEAHMGMQCQCPQCGMAFIIPTVERPAGSSAVDNLIASVGDEMDEPSPFSAALEEPPPRRPREQHAPSKLNLSELGTTTLEDAALGESNLHIPCPNGHELETPPEMVGRRAMCPHCGAQFRLKREKSVEYLRQQEILDAKRSEFWFKAAITAACVVGAVLVVMMLITALK